MIAALFVSATGPYANLPDVDVWGISRDARLYAGPWPVVAHPPCERWGNYWHGGPGWKGPRKQLGADGGCFVTALASVRRWGGVLEHPAGSRAWAAFGLRQPDRSGGWVAADFHGGMTCWVDQGHYGHRAPKPTWLYACHVTLPSLIWGRADAGVVIPAGASEIERRRLVRTGVCQRLSKKQRAETPIQFRDLLLSMAASVTERAA